MKHHNCELMESWLMDERVPLQRRKGTGEFVLTVNADLVLAISYCPFCGVDLSGSAKSSAHRAGDCKHLIELAAMPNSAIRYRPHAQEFVIAGAQNLTVCLFFCPICGCELVQHQEDRCRKSPSEIVRLEKLFANVHSIEQAVKQLGTPDFDGGQALDQFFWKRERLDAGYRRFLVYQRLAKTIDVHVIEWLNGKVDVKFVAKLSSLGQTAAPNSS